MAKLPIIRPKHLNKGDGIGFFSPSIPATLYKKRFLRAQNFMEDKGFKLYPGELTGKSDHYRSGTIKERVNELNTLIRNPKVRCIISTTGGMNSNSLLPYIDYEALKRDPKVIIGYSDVTAILLGIYAQTGLITFYGPALVASFGEIGQFVEMTYQYFSDILVKPVEYPFSIPNPAFWTDEFIDWDNQHKEKKKVKNKLVTVKKGKAKGRLIAGNLNTISGAIYGSPYMPEINKGDILLIEDSLKNAEIIERSFAHMKINGVFDKIGGLILGKHERFDDQGTKKRPYEIMMEVIDKTSIPILADYDCCHTHPMITLPIGVNVELDATAQQLTLLSDWIK